MQRPGEPPPPHAADGVTGAAGAPAGGGSDRPAADPPWSPEPSAAPGAPHPGGSGGSGADPGPGWAAYPGAGSAGGSGWAPGDGAGPGAYGTGAYGIGAYGTGAYGTGAYGTAGAGYPPMSPVEGSYPVDHRAARSRAKLWPPSRAELVTAASLLVGLAVVGAALAVLWVRLAPRLNYRVDQPGRALPVAPEAEEFIAADGRYVLLTLAAGIVAGLVAWLVTRSRGPLVLLTLAAAGLLGAVVTWRLGVALAPGFEPAELQEVGRLVQQPLTLRAEAALVVEPFAAVLVYLLAAGFATRNDLGRDDDVQEPPPLFPTPYGHQDQATFSSGSG